MSRYKSRLDRRKELRTKRSLFVMLGGIFLIGFLLAKFGIPVLINISMFISSIGRREEAMKQDDKTFVATPVLNPLSSATNSAQIEVSGKSDPSFRVILFVNEENADETEVKSDFSFTFTKVKLNSGTNTIKVKAINKDKKESDYSGDVVILYKKEPPSLLVESPKDGQSFTKEESPITVSGKTDAGTKVTVNEFWAIVDEFGNFSYSVRLQNGENTIKVVAVDEAGNKTEVERKVNYSP